MSHATARDVGPQFNPAESPLAEKTSQSSVVPVGSMRDIELSTRNIPVEGLFGWLKPWFGLTDAEFGERCKSSTFSYLCLDVKYIHIIDASYNEIRLRCGHFLDNLGVPRLFCEESLDISTASSNSSSSIIGANHVPRGDQNDTAEAVSSWDTYSKGTEGSLLGPQILHGSLEGSLGDCGLGSLEGYCNMRHPFFVTLRRMWNEPDLYGPIWINVLTAGSLFLLYTFYQHVSGGGGAGGHDYDDSSPLLSLTKLSKLTMICLSCSLSMSAGIVCCRRVAVGEFDRSMWLPTFCGCGYMQIPVILLSHFVVWSSVLKYYIPALSVFLTMLHVLIIAYVCASTVSTVVLYIPAMSNSADDMKFKASSAMVTCILQMGFYAWLETFM